MKKSEQNLTKDMIKVTTICVMEVEEKEDRKRGMRSLKQIKAKNFPNLGKDTDIQVQGQ